MNVQKTARKSSRTSSQTSKASGVKFQDSAVGAVFAAYPEKARQRLLRVRQLIFDVAVATDGVGELTEALRWGEPAYLTQTSKSGSTIRLGIPKRELRRDAPEKIAVYFHCQTTLVGDFRRSFADSFEFDGNRAIILRTTGAMATGPLKQCIRAALTYHLSKRTGRS